MSDLSQFLHKAEAWLSGIAGPSASATVTDAASKVSAAASAIEGAMPAVATAAANAALALIPGGLGTDFDPIADSLIDSVVALLLGKKSTATPPQAPAAPAPGTVVN